MADGAMVCNLQTREEEISWKQELEVFQSQVDSLQDKLLELKVVFQGSEDDAKSELDILWCKVGAISTLLAYLKSKAKKMTVTHLAHYSCMTDYEDGTALTGGSEVINISSLECPSGEASLTSRFKLVSLGDNDRSYTRELVKSVGMVTDIMESLVKRVIIAETEVANEKEKVNLGLTELRRKALQIERMSAKVKEMEHFTACTNDKLNEMRQKVDHMVQETSRQKQHAAENEQELSRVKQDFEMLKSYVNHIIRSREDLLLSESQVQTREVLDRTGARGRRLDLLRERTNSTTFKHQVIQSVKLVEKNSRLENDKVQKEAEVQKLMEENVKLRNLLDKREAQLLAMNEQCKFMALNKPGN